MNYLILHPNPDFISHLFGKLKLKRRTISDFEELNLTSSAKKWLDYPIESLESFFSPTNLTKIQKSLILNQDLHLIFIDFDLGLFDQKNLEPSRFEIWEKDHALKKLKNLLAVQKKEEHEKAKIKNRLKFINQMPSVLHNYEMQKAWRLILNAAKSDVTVLITGPSGVGKEIFARALHHLSGRSKKKMVALNCASVPANLLEAELFGSEKGAYTGAHRMRQGQLELAQNSSLLLDEIGEMDLSLQAKILRVIQEKEIYRIGGNEKIELNFRLIAATNRDLKKEVENQRFREDLFYRLNVIHVDILPLAKRKEDIPYLGQYFLDRFNLENPAKNLLFSKNAIDQLKDYSWPGNVRELENVLLRTFYLSSRREIKEIVFDKVQTNKPNPLQIDNDLTLEQMEKIMIVQALNRYQGNRSQVASSLGISVRTLRNKLKTYREGIQSQKKSKTQIADYEYSPYFWTHQPSESANS